MSLAHEEIDRIANEIALAYRAGRVSHDAGLHCLSGMADAEEVQEAVLRILGNPQIGYALGATSAITGRLLGCPEPVAAPFLQGATLEDGATYLLPQGTIGAGAGFCFVLGRPLENPADGATDECEAANACLACHIELHLLGRRVSHGTPLNASTATADLGLALIHVIGPRVPDWRAVDLAATAIVLSLDGHVVARGMGADTFGTPIAGVAWLARRLSDRGLRIEAGEVVATGSCIGLVQVVPGQRIRADFAGIGAVSLDVV